MKHTKGKWTIKESNGEIHIWAPGIPRIAIVTSRDVSINEWRANAKLIASAPLMIEALQTTNNYFIDLQNKCALACQDERAWKLVSLAIKTATE